MDPLLSRKRALGVAFAFAFLKLLVHLLTLRPYGFFRDELYYVACSEHLDWGYVDQPPLSVVVLKAWRLVFGDSLASIRLIPAIIGATTVLVTGLLAVELGGGALAVGLAGLAVLTAGQFLGSAHYYSMNVFDQLFWVLAAFLVVRALGDGSGRTWVALGITLGLALLNKVSVLWFGAGLSVGLLATPAKGVLKTRWPYVALALVVVLFTPYIAWEIRHGWPTREFMHNAMAHKYIERSTLKFVGAQLEQNNPFTLPIWLSGLFALLTRRLGERVAVLGWIYVTVFFILMLDKTAKAEYLSPTYPMLMAAGGVFWERALRTISRAWARRTLIISLAIAMIAGGVLSAPFALALLPEETFIAYQSALGIKPESAERKQLGKLPQFYADMHGWAELTHLVASIYDSLSPSEKARATIWVRSGGYGPAAAIDFFGRKERLPHAICGHNNYWYWGPGNGDGQAVIVVGGKAEWIARQFESFEQVATFECRYCRPDENHKPIYLGRRMTTPLAALWADERYFD